MKGIAAILVAVAAQAIAVSALAAVDYFPVMADGSFKVGTSDGEGFTNAGTRPRHAWGTGATTSAG